MMSVFSAKTLMSKRRKSPFRHSIAGFLLALATTLEGSGSSSSGVEIQKRSYLERDPAA